MARMTRSRRSATATRLADSPNHSSLAAATLDDLLSASESLRTVEVPEINRVVYMRPLSAGEVLDYGDAQSRGDESAKTNAMITLVARAICNEDGTPMFASDADLIRLRASSMKVFNRLMQAVMGDLSVPLDESASPSGFDSPTDSLPS